jgi:hypothetical protein
MSVYQSLLDNESYLVNTSQLNTQLLNCILNSLTNECLIEFNSRINSLLLVRENLTEITASRAPLMLFMNALSRKPFVNFLRTVLVSKYLQLSVFVSMETVFRNQLFSKNQFLRGKVFAHSFPRNGPHVTICMLCSTDCWMLTWCNVGMSDE